MKVLDKEVYLFDTNQNNAAIAAEELYEEVSWRGDVAIYGTTCLVGREKSYKYKERLSNKITQILDEYGIKYVIKNLD